MKNNPRWMFITIIFLMVCVTISSLGGASSTTVAVNPSEVIDLSPGETFSVDITVEDVTDLYGWSVNLTFHSEVLNVENVTEGPFLKQFGNTFFLPGQTNNVVGFLTPGGMLFDPTQDPPFPPEGATGDGVLATITFSVKGSGVANLHFEASKLNTVVASNNVPITHTAKDGLFRNVASTPLSIELIIAITAVIAVGGSIAVFLYRRKTAKT